MSHFCMRNVCKFEDIARLLLQSEVKTAWILCEIFRLSESQNEQLMGEIPFCHLDQSWVTYPSLFHYCMLVLRS